MASIAAKPDLWSLVRGTPRIDPTSLLAAIESEARHPPHDFRTRLLLQESYRALEHLWGTEKITSHLSADVRATLEAILAEDLGDPGFPSLERRIMEQTDAQTILRFLREISEAVTQPIHLDIGGSSSLILSGLLSRGTEDIDVVDEVPAAIRSQHELLSSLASRYGLHLAHFQSHYLPAGWQERVRSLGQFGNLAVRLIDAHDIFIGKLFSAREKDRDDLQLMSTALDKSRVAEHLKATAQALLAEERLRAQAEKNWYVLYGEPLPQ